ncbi:multicopper oxidase domain-containing protein [Mesorhizobium qingshengii]|uniref:Multicopper oxidase domain-containing protein n=1 Tax=Mesorhizobium qingshengii TaxID=1165689 RepID=A0ABT4R581_9HYPH|nr:multicopper oxidase domain-containing protein [Mesorhizobium qingshengii]MCZ8548713.1 multicopper oxidase domain-containing protein [Mesorhizobium qingshengii]
MKFGRRSLLIGAAAIGAGALVTRPLWYASGAAVEPQSLRIPALLDARALANSVSLEVQAGNTEFFPGRASPTLGYNGGHLGPTIRVNRGDDVEIAVTNRLAEDTTVHWHGLLAPAELDDGPHQLIKSSSTWRPRLPVRQPAATLFYHAHVHGRTGAQVYSGLAGVLIVTDNEERALGLPSEYGVDDLPLVFQDRLFEDGLMVLPEGMMTVMQGRRGNTTLVNGTPNAGLSAALQTAPDTNLPMMMGQGSRVWNLARNITGGGDEVVLRFEPTGQQDPAAPLGRLVSRQSVNAYQATKRRQFVLGMGMGGMMGGGIGSSAGMTINGRPFEMGRIDERVALGDTEIWEISGEMMSHPFHFHGVQSEVLSRNRGKPIARDAGIRDTVLVREPVELLVRFTQPAVRAPFMYHCHILEHKDDGMMGQFATT